MHYLIRPARAEDNNGILGLIRETPQPGRVLLNFEREPRFFDGSQVTCEEPDNWVVETRGGGGSQRPPDHAQADQVETAHFELPRDRRIVGTFSIGRRAMYINGKVQRIRYANDLRLAPDLQGGRMLLRMARKLAEQMGTDEWMQTVILSDNRTSLNTVASGRAGLPTYYPCGEIETSMLFSYPRRRRHGLRVRRASIDDLADMQHWLDEQGPRRQFFPRYRLENLLAGDDYYRGLKIDDFWLALRGGQLVGMLGIWNQKSFKQTRVLAYPRGLSWLRHFYNLYTALYGGIRLPPAGGTLSYLTLHSVLVENDDAAIFDALLAAVMQEYLPRFGALISGFFQGDPLARALEGCRRQVMHSRHFLASYGDDPRQQLDGRLPYVEVARL